MPLLNCASVVPDEELNLILVKLLEFLGHRNQIVSAFAVNEVRKEIACLRKIQTLTR